MLVGFGGIELFIYVVEEINLGGIAGKALFEGFAGMAEGFRRIASRFYTDIAEGKYIVIVQIGSEYERRSAECGDAVFST